MVLRIEKEFSDRKARRRVGSQAWASWAGTHLAHSTPARAEETEGRL